MDRCSWQALIEQEVIEQVDSGLGITEDDGPGGFHLEEEVVDGIALLVLIDQNDVLADVLMCGTSASNRDTGVVLGQVLAGYLAHVFLKGGREHEIDVVRIFVRV